MNAPAALAQYLQAFTVQVRHRKRTAQIVGTGFIVSRDGKIATCKHVVTAADVKPIPTTSDESQAVGIYFPEMPNRLPLLSKARVFATFPNHEDDIVLLQLIEPVAENYLGRFAVLGRAEDSFLQPFVSYGFARLDEYIGHSAKGEIHILVQRPEGHLAAPFELASDRINRGMSGAAVLDLRRNLVVGIVSEIFDSRGTPQNRDAGFAVNARLLSEMGSEVEIRESNYDFEMAPRPEADINEARQAASDQNDFALNGAPEEQRDWVGRDEQLINLQRDWKDPNTRITALIGFGGEGKSSLVRRWLDHFIRPGSDLRADGVFWWAFSETQTVERFFNEALKYVGAPRLDVSVLKSSTSRLHFLAAMLTDKRYIFVLDQLEKVQHPGGDKRGYVVDSQLRLFLELFGAPSHQSFCVITSRLSVADLGRYLKTFAERDLDRLTPEEGRSLLKRIGIMGSKKALDRIVEAWDGHALTINVVGGYLLSSHEGKADKADLIPAPDTAEPGYQRIHNLLAWYNAELSPPERVLLMVATIFRTSVSRSELQFVADTEPVGPLRTFFQGLDSVTCEALVDALVRRRLLRHDTDSDRYFLHSLIRRHYSDQLSMANPSQVRELHRRIKAQYLSRNLELPSSPTMSDLSPLIEAVYHATRAGDFEDAFQIYWFQISRQDQGVLIHQLGAIETDLALVKQFFPEEKLEGEPLVANPQHRNWLINQAGLCMAGMGNLGQSSDLLKRSVRNAVPQRFWLEAGTSSTNLAVIETFLGALGTARKRARAAYRYGMRLSDARLRMQSAATLGRIEYLCGRTDRAIPLFEEAQKLELEHRPDVSCLSGASGIFYSELLEKLGRLEEAQAIAQANFRYSSDGRLPLRSLAHNRIAELGVGLSDSTREFHHDEAVRVARMIGRREILLHVLVARGRWSVELCNIERASADLREALDLAMRGGYRIVEIEARLGFAALYRQRKEMEDCSREMRMATTLAAEIGYHWVN